MRLALFDLDNTLLAGDSDYEWGQFLVDRGVLEREAYEAQNRAFYEQYKAGTLDIHEFLGFALRPLAAHAPAELDALARASSWRARIRPMIGAPARALVREHRRRGDLCAIITATNSFVTAPIAREFGIEHLIATEPERSDGRFTGQVAGTPCFREGKVARLDDVARRARPAPRRLRRVDLLQRLAQRPAAARARDAPGGGGSRRRSSRAAAEAARLGRDFPARLESAATE